MRLSSLASWCIVGFGISGAAFAGPMGTVGNVVVLEDRLGPAQDECESFNVDANLAQEFFEASVVITGRQRHDYFLYGPCYARGTLETKYGSWEWELRNLGTGHLKSITGELFIVADPAQESPLSEE